MRRLKTVRRPPIYPKTPGHLPCSSLTHPLPLSSRRPSVSFGGFGLTEILDLHAQGEEEVVFPAVNNVAPLVAPLFVTDHREMDIMCAGLEQVVGAPDELAAARASAVLHSHMRIHLAKEDSHLYPILRERISSQDQAPIVGQMAGKVPPQLMPKLVDWLYPLVNQDDRVTMTAVWKGLMPEEIFAGVKQLIQGAVGADDWSELTRRVPGLT